MGIVQIELPDDLRGTIHEKVAAGEFADEGEFVTHVVRLLADSLNGGDEIAAMLLRADKDIAAGRYDAVCAHDESDAHHLAAMPRLRARLPGIEKT